MVASCILIVSWFDFCPRIFKWGMPRRWHMEFGIVGILAHAVCCLVGTFGIELYIPLQYSDHSASHLPSCEYAQRHPVFQTCDLRAT